MSVAQILQIVIYSIMFIASLVSAIIGFVKAAKQKKLAKTAEEEAAANQKMLDEANKLISEAETFFSSLDKVLKSTEGTSAGIYKKESVMTKLQQYATSIGAAFDADYWSNKIDEIVAMTKQVNAK